MTFASAQITFHNPQCISPPYLDQSPYVTLLVFHNAINHRCNQYLLGANTLSGQLTSIPFSILIPFRFLFDGSEMFLYLWNKFSFIIQHNEVVGGVYWFHSVRPSVCPSVRPSVCPSVPHAVSALYHLQLWMDSFHIRHKWSLPWEGVSRTMTFDLDLYLQGHLALT